jgi:hypothetical protein
MNRRGFLSFLGGGLVAAPAIVRAASLMPVKALLLPPLPKPWVCSQGGFLVPDEIMADIMAMREQFGVLQSESQFVPMVDSRLPRWAKVLRA